MSNLKLTMNKFIKKIKHLKKECDKHWNKHCYEIGRETGQIGFTVFYKCKKCGKIFYGIEEY